MINRYTRKLGGQKKAIVLLIVLKCAAYQVTK